MGKDNNSSNEEQVVVGQGETHLLDEILGLFHRQHVGDGKKKFKIIAIKGDRIRIEKINKIDGLFYTMDDNIINLNILNMYDPNKIIYKYGKNKSLSTYKGWHWDKNWGKNAIYNLEKDSVYQKFEINTYSGGFSDYFYLPKKYLSKKLFDLFQLFAKYNVFLELAIPTIIRHIEPNKIKVSENGIKILRGLNIIDKLTK